MRSTDSDNGFIDIKFGSVFTNGLPSAPCLVKGMELKLAYPNRLCKVENVRRGHWLRCSDNKIHRVQEVVRGTSHDVYFFRPGALGVNFPRKEIGITGNHMIRMPNGKVWRARDAFNKLCRPGFGRRSTRPREIYHFHTAKWTFTNVHGLDVETCCLTDENIDRRFQVYRRLGVRSLSK